MKAICENATTCDVKECTHQEVHEWTDLCHGSMCLGEHRKCHVVPDAPNAPFSNDAGCVLQMITGRDGEHYLALISSKEGGVDKFYGPLSCNEKSAFQLLCSLPKVEKDPR